MTQRIVVVDDAALNRRVFAGMLDALPDVAVSTFAGTEEALAAAPSLDPSLFIVDYRMPPPDGMELLTRLRADPRTRETPVVMVTSAEELEVRYAALEHGASDFLVRPVDPREFQRRVSNLLALDAARRDASERLGQEVAAARLQAKRLDLIWRAGVRTAGDDQAYLTQLLDEVSRVVAEDRVYAGRIVRVDGTEFVVEHASEAGLPEIFPVGARYRFDGIEDLLAAGVAGAREARPPPGSANLAFQAMLYAPFRCGTATYYVYFGSRQPAERRFTRFDVNFVETIAAMCASRLDQRAQFARLQYQTEHDALTGLPNRTTFRAHGFAALRADARGSVFVLNIDNFRHVNDRLGHKTGDALLVEVGARLNADAVADEFVARLGGDSFGILAPGCGSRSDAEAVARRFLDAFRSPFGTGDREDLERVPLGASIGIAVAPADGADFEQLLARADAACYVARDAGGGRWAFAEEAADEPLASIRVLQSELGTAAARSEFVLHFQPQVELDSGRVIGAEALVRWQHPKRGLVAPAEFLPFAERYGLAGAIGSWVMRETARLSRERRRRDPAFRVWFNVSAVELRDAALLERLRDLGDLAGLGVEITEAAAMENPTETLRMLESFHRAGLRIALDDFGTGSGTLAQLGRLPLDLVKIDRTFVGGLPGGEFDAAVVGAALAIARSFGFPVLAEGVETHEQARYLQAAGCAFGQGFLYGAGVPASEFGHGGAPL